MKNIQQLKKEEIDFIKRNLDNAEKLLNSEDMNDLLWEIDDWIIANGFNDDYSLNDIGDYVQKMYDNIYYRYD